MTHLSLFSGIGGLDLAAEMAGFTTVGQCEWADYPTKVLEKHWPDVPRWRDIRTLTKESFYERTGLRTVDIVSGGFPCQPFSTAGKRKGKEDDRYLCPEMLRVIQEIRPRWVVGENVAGIVSMALDTVLSDLEGIGYTCEALVFPACAVDAPHRRDRTAIVAYYNSIRFLHRRDEVNATETGKQTQFESVGCCETLANTFSIGFRENGNQSAPDCEWNNPSSQQERWTELCPSGCGSSHVCDTDITQLENAVRSPKTPGNGRHSDPNRRGFESRMGGVADGLSSWMDKGMSSPGAWLPDPSPFIPRITANMIHRVDRLKCLGNAVVPQQFYPIFQAIADYERMAID